MARILSVVIVLFSGPRAFAQQPEPPWAERLVDGNLVGWVIDQGESRIDGKDLVLGGKAETKIRLTTPLGEDFKLHLDYTFSGAGRPNLHWQWPPMTKSFEGMADATTEWKITGKQGGWRRSYSLSHSYESRGKSGASSGSGGLNSGSGTVETFWIVVPPGATLTLRRLALQTQAPVTPSTAAPYVALAVLAGIFGGVVILGWYLERKRRKSGGAGRS